MTARVMARKRDRAEPARRASRRNRLRARPAEGHPSLVRLPAGVANRSATRDR